ncbi:MAG TPA: DUF5818 domain-containing protein [Thermoanaerobaculia bacterium]
MKRTIALLACLAVISLMVAPIAAAAAGTAGSWNGWIVDEKCGAKDANAGAAACVTKCNDKGAKLVLYNGADKKLYKLDKQDVAKGHIGHEVTVKGTATGSSIAVDSIEAAAPAKSK